MSMINTYPNSASGKGTCLRNSAISKRVPMMRETVPDKAQLAFLDVLFDRIIRLIFANFLLRIRPARDFNNHVENLRGGGRRRSEEGDIMPRGDDNTISLKEDAMFERVW